MTVSASPTLDTLRLKLIKTQQLTPATPISQQEIVQYLIQALAHADRAFSNEIETALTQLGFQAIPQLLKGLESPALNIRSTCAMVLIRIGRPAARPLQKLYRHHADNAQLNWVIRFILDEMGLAPSKANSQVQARMDRRALPQPQVVPLRRAG